MSDDTRVLTTFYEGWAIYQKNLLDAVAALTPEQLELHIADHLRSVGDLLTHLVSTRARWMLYGLAEGDEKIGAIAQWQDPGAPVRTPAELAEGLERTWTLIHDALGRWTLDEMAEPIQREWRGETQTLTRQWVIWHLIEHDLHHGGELAFALGMHGIQANEI